MLPDRQIPVARPDVEQAGRQPLRPGEVVSRDLTNRNPGKPFAQNKKNSDGLRIRSRRLQPPDRRG